MCTGLSRCGRARTGNFFFDASRYCCRANVISMLNSTVSANDVSVVCALRGYDRRDSRATLFDYSTTLYIDAYNTTTKAWMKKKMQKLFWTVHNCSLYSRKVLDARLCSIRRLKTIHWSFQGQFYRDFSSITHTRRSYIVICIWRFKVFQIRNTRYVF